MMEYPGGKRRTRAHIIADLSVNHVERHVLLCGYTVKRATHDYGIDLEVQTFNRNGEIEHGNILIQLKATDKIKVRADSIACRIERANLVYWLAEPLPVILIAYDAAQDVANWVYVQSYFAKLKNFNLFQAGRTITVRVPKQNIVDVNAVRRFAGFRDRVRRQMSEVKHDED
jgi:hypothetical protein